MSIRILRVPPASILILLLLFARVMPGIIAGRSNYRAFLNSLPSFVNLLDIEASSGWGNGDRERNLDLKSSKHITIRPTALAIQTFRCPEGAASPMSLAHP